MNRLLRLFLPVQWPAQEAACDWVLVDAAGHPLQRGRSEARHWPEAESCEIVLGAEQCLLLQVALPRNAQARLPEVIAFALEEHLIGNTEAEHFVAGDSDGDGLAPVWVVSRARLASLLAALKSVGRVPARACCEIQLVPLEAGRWSVCLHRRSDEASLAGRWSGFVRTGAEQGFACDLVEASAPGTPPLELQLALATAQRSGQAPQAIGIHLAPGSGGESVQAIAAAWQSALGLPVQGGAEFAWQEAGAAASRARNLLAQEFAPPRRPGEGWSSLRPALYLGIVALVLLALFVVGDWARLRLQANGLQQQMLASFRSTFPQAQAAIDPPLQMQRLYDQARRQHGQLGAGDFLPLLAAASDAVVGKGRLSKVSYEDGRLELAIVLPNADSAERLRDALRGRGLAVTLRETHAAKSGAQAVEAVFALRSAP